MILHEGDKAELKRLMRISAEKGNLANAGMVIEADRSIAFAESLVASDHDATAHSERMLVQDVCALKKSNYTPGLTMFSVVEPCVMCMSACSQAGYSIYAYIIPAKKYFKRFPYVTDGIDIDKDGLAKQFTEPLDLIHLKEYEEEFCEVFEDAMKDLFIA